MQIKNDQKWSKNVIVIVIVRVPHNCGIDIDGMKIMPQMSDIATIQDIFGMLIFEDET